MFTAIRILKSLFSYLVQAEYLRVNPIKLIKKYKKLSIKPEEQKHEIRKRILDLDEWQAIQDAILAMSEAASFERDNKNRTQFLFALLYFLALRIHEVANHTWGDFYEENGKWWFLAKGKGDGVGHVPVNHQLLEHIKAYREYLGKTPLPNFDGKEHLLISQKTGKPLKLTRLYSLVKSLDKWQPKVFQKNRKPTKN